ncbi:ankyrin repeat and EF-hand domain-containing protein 1a [Oryzias melastigma]|uniref:ankyrin repeat and EF-hand domain-containing protein 1a n=1 Tax=Oryzias melastigma TaxID=30732 RepID=UPI000CF7B7C5|nr:ankyrin repeat and EF-hand domain-containing protein 1a [Oryzias melastigma]XP_024146886.1 ankyrin repeat and EF-hand domain-containing protein 1a [Oryzias melastigma]
MNDITVLERLQTLQIYRLLQHVRSGNKDEIEKMLKLGVTNLINLRDPQGGLVSLHLATSANNLDLVDFLLSRGAHPDVQDKGGHTSVMLAAKLGSDDIVTRLTQSQADMRIVDSAGKGVLFYCISPKKSHARCLRVALENRADVNNISSEGVHVFQLMCEKALVCTPLCLMMVDGGADPNAKNEKTGVTALMEAVKAGSLQLVRAILKRGGNPDVLDKSRCTAMHYAAMGGFFEVIRALSAYSAPMNVIDLDACTPLHHAAASGNADCCRFLAQRGCNPKLKNLKGLTPSQIAKERGYKAAVQELKKAERQQGNDKASKGGRAPFELWALTLYDWSHEYEAELRQAFGAETVNLRTFISVLTTLKAPVGPDNLHTVISAHDKKKEGLINVADFLKGVNYLKKEALFLSPKKGKDEKGGKKKGKFNPPFPICVLPLEKMPRRPNGGPPLFMIEKYKSRWDICRFDSKHPPEHPIMNDSEWYLDKPDTEYVNINYCVESGDLESLDLAFSKGVPVDVQDTCYKTPLITACDSGSLEMVQYLLNRGADVNKCDQFFWTPIHHAAHAGHVEIVELLVKAGADVDAQSLSGATPLMRAIETGQSSCVHFLVKAGANVYLENRKGQNCLRVAQGFANSTIVDIVKAGMKSLPKSSDGMKGSGVKSQKPVKKKAVAPEHAETVTTMSGSKILQMDSKSVVLQNARIKSKEANPVDITFQPNTVWGEPPTTSQLLSNIQRRRKSVTVDVDLEDILMPYGQSIHRKIVELSKMKDLVVLH